MKLLSSFLITAIFSFSMLTAFSYGILTAVYPSKALGYDSIAQNAFAKTDNGTSANDNIGQQWSKYSNDSNAVSFEYPTLWKVEENANANGPIIKVFNQSSMENSFDVELPNPSMTYEINYFSSIQDWANNTLAKSNETASTTITEPFIEETINGYPASMGKLVSVSKAITQKTAATTTSLAIIIHNGQIYKISYSDTSDNYGTTSSQDIMKRMFNSFSLK